MAPELFDADDAGHETTVSSRASDIYALSMVVIEVLLNELGISYELLTFFSGSYRRPTILSIS
jgi:hypothetical protein